MLLSKESGKSVDLKNGLQAVRMYNKLKFVKQISITDDSYNYEVKDIPYKIEDEKFIIKFEAVNPEKQKKSQMKL